MSLRLSPSSKELIRSSVGMFIPVLASTCPWEIYLVPEFQGKKVYMLADPKPKVPTMN